MTSESRKREALHSETEGQVLLNPQQLLPGVDYL